MSEINRKLIYTGAAAAWISDRAQDHCDDSYINPRDFSCKICE